MVEERYSPFQLIPDRNKSNTDDMRVAGTNLQFIGQAVSGVVVSRSGARHNRVYSTTEGENREM